MKAWKVASTSAIALKNNLLMELMLREDQVEIVEGVCGIVDDSFVARKGNDVTIGTFNNAEPEPSLTESEEGDNEVYLAVTAPLGRSTLSPEEIENHIERYELYDYQRVGVRHLVGSTSALLADDMGLGKTRQAVAAAHILAGNEKILITCPASLIINWTREIRMLVPDATIAQQEFDPACQWIVTNYERLDSMIHHARHFKVMVTDEAHLLKEPTSKRTRLAFDVASKVPYRFILTGTPILNRECEIHTLLRLSGHPVGNIPLKTFEEQFAGDPAFRVALNQRISEWMLRRKKDVVLKTLKGKQHQISFVSPSEEQRTQYDALANNSMLQALPKIVKLRVLLEQIKVDSVIELVREMNSDDKVLVFCEFKETVAALREQLQAMGVGVVTMVGSDSITRRQKAVDAFQSDPEKRAFVGTTSAAGVGNNLTAANYVIFASLPWTPALKDQAEDRAYRNGQLRLVIVKIPLMENTIDQDLWEMLKHKKGIATEILDPEEAEAAAMAELANRIAA
jgi:SNF2 family DNA or RNA helicase